MDGGEGVPESGPGMNGCHPLDKMAVGKLWPLCISEQELGREREQMDGKVS